MRPREPSWRTYQCRQCGKVFDALTGWAYAMETGHRQRRMFCSWHCLQTYRREHPERVCRKYKDA